jgi:hypothetical protein
MKFYHTCPAEYLDKQYVGGEWHPHWGATWLAIDPWHSLQASQQTSARKVIVEFDLAATDVEDHSDMPVCRRLHRPYYIKRGSVAQDQVKIFAELEAAA